MAVKKLIQAKRFIPLFCQRLAIDDQLLANGDVLAHLPRPVTLTFVELCYVADADAGPRLLDASRNGHARVLEQIIHEPAFPDHSAVRGRTPLWFGSLYGHLLVVSLLVEAGADKDKARQDGRTPLSIASRQGLLEVARLLCESGAVRTRRSTTA